MLGVGKALMKCDADSASNWLENKSLWPLLKVKYSAFDYFPQQHIGNI